RAPRGLGSPRGAGMSVTGPSAARERLRTLLGLAADAPPARIAQSPSAPDGAEPAEGRGVAPGGTDSPACLPRPDPPLAIGAGLTVLCPEMLSFGRRRFPRPEGAPAYEPAENSCGIDAARELLHGRPLMGRRAADARAAVQALRQLPGVDPQRVAVAGGSGG